MLENIVTKVLMTVVVLFLGGVFVWKSKLLAEGEYQAVLSGDKSVTSALCYQLIMGSLFAVLAIAGLFASYGVIGYVGYYGFAICGGKAYFDLLYGLRLLRYKKQTQQKSHSPKHR